MAFSWKHWLISLATMIFCFAIVFSLTGSFDNPLLRVVMLIVVPVLLGFIMAKLEQS